MAADSERKRVHFRSPEDLVEQADALADIEGSDRTDIIIEALRRYIAETTEDEQFRQRIAQSYYDDQIGFEVVEALVGSEQAQTFRLLKRDIESESLDVPEPDQETDIYDGETATVDPEE